MAGTESACHNPEKMAVSTPHAGDMDLLFHAGVCVLLRVSVYARSCHRDRVRLWADSCIGGVRILHTFHGHPLQRWSGTMEHSHYLRALALRHTRHRGSGFQHSGLVSSVGHVDSVRYHHSHLHRSHLSFSESYSANASRRWSRASRSLTRGNPTLSRMKPSPPWPNMVPLLSAR